MRHKVSDDEAAAAYEHHIIFLSGCLRSLHSRGNVGEGLAG